MQKIKNFHFICGALLLLSLTGCSIYHVHSKDTSTEYYPSKNSYRDIVYLENVERPHKIIGNVTVNTERRQSMTDVIERMKYEAAILGGDAITNIQSDATGQWKKIPAQKMIGNAYVRANFSAQVVIFK